MLKTSGIPFDERQVLDALYGPDDDPRWHSVVEPHELTPCIITKSSSISKKAEINSDDFEVIDF